jgi:hypothetical protein
MLGGTRQEAGMSWSGRTERERYRKLRVAEIKLRSTAARCRQGTERR